MPDFSEVKTSIGLVDGNIVLMFDEPVDVVAYGVDAAEEVANKMIELIKQVREPLTKS